MEEENSFIWAFKWFILSFHLGLKNVSDLSRPSGFFQLHHLIPSVFAFWTRFYTSCIHFLSIYYFWTPFNKYSASTDLLKSLFEGFQHIYLKTDYISLMFAFVGLHTYMYMHTHTSHFWRASPLFPFWLLYLPEIAPTYLNHSFHLFCWLLL
jgi:hypothetical protein